MIALVLCLSVIHKLRECCTFCWRVQPCHLSHVLHDVVNGRMRSDRLKVERMSVLTQSRST